MKNIRLCLECAWEHQIQLNMEMPDTHANQQAIAEEVTEAQATVMDASTGLSWFQLKPIGLTGKPLLEHMFTH
jgi:hypothetical protein